MIDEIDKSEGSPGDPASALLEVLDTKAEQTPSSTAIWRSLTDLSHTLSGTANMLDTIRARCRDRRR